MIFRIWPLIQMSSLEQAFPSLVWLKEPTEAGKDCLWCSKRYKGCYKGLRTLNNAFRLGMFLIHGK